MKKVLRKLPTRHARGKKADFYFRETPIPEILLVLIAFETGVLACLTWLPPFVQY